MWDGILFTADPNMTSAATSIATYFSHNIGTVVGVVVAVAFFCWILMMLFYSIGVHKPQDILDGPSRSTFSKEGWDQGGNDGF